MRSGEEPAARRRRPRARPAGEARIAWAGGQMPVLAQIRERFAVERPLDGIRVAACLHVTAETANLVRALNAGGARVALCSANPLSTQDDVAAALVAGDGVEVRALRGEELDEYVSTSLALLGDRPQVTLDDGADLLVTAHATGGELVEGLIGGTEETTTGLVRLRRLEDAGQAALPGAGRQRGAHRAGAQRPARHRPVGARRDRAGRATCCWPATRSSSSATAGRDRGSPSAPAAPGRPWSCARSTRCARWRRGWRATR